MKCSIFTVILLLIFASVNSQSLLISAISSPIDEKTNGKFVALYNATNSTIDFDTTPYYIARETNGGGTIGNKLLVGQLVAKGVYVIAGRSAFVDVYAKAGDCMAGCVTGNGNDAYFLYKDGDETSGTLIDIFGELGVDGSSTAWDYTNSFVMRKPSVTSGSTVWNSQEWTFYRDATAKSIQPWSYNSAPLSIKKNKMGGEVKVFPNPVVTSLNISSQSPIASLSVIDLLGCIVFTMEFNGNETIMLDMTPFSSGIYTILLTDLKGDYYSQKIVKE